MTTPKTLELEAHDVQQSHWPTSGKHILAQYDEERVVVYQAYRPSIGLAAARDGVFGGGGFSFERMSWIKPNFLWMMYRSGWGTKENQETCLAISLRRSFFNLLLEEAVASSYSASAFSSIEKWRVATKASTVRLQWDPDHAPTLEPLERRAVQLGLRGSALAAFKGDAIIEIEDISAFVEVQRRERTRSNLLLLPRERIYQPSPLGASNVGLTSIVFNFTQVE